MGYNIDQRDMQTTTQSQPISQQNNYIYKAQNLNIYFDNNGGVKT